MLLSSFAGAESQSKPSVDDKSMSLIRGVYGIDLSKYQVIVNASGTVNTGVSTFGPGVIKECGDFTLVNSESTLYFDFRFVNGNLWYCTLDIIKGSPIYVPTLPTDIIAQSKIMLSNYQTFATQNYAGDTSYISSAENMLNNVSELKNTQVNSSDAKMEIKDSAHTSLDYKNETNTTQFSQINLYFSHDGVDYPQKTLSLHFLNGNLYDFCDTWSIISIGAPNVLSRAEALELAAAKNLNLSFNSENGSTYEVKPNLTNATVNDIHLSYTNMNSTELHPLWFIYIFFNQSINGDYGIQVSIWGDTKEVYSCQALTTLGTPDIPSTSLSSDSHNGQPMQDNTLWFVLLGIMVTVIATALIVWTARKPTQNNVPK